MTFFEWLKTQVGREDLVGDFANDAIHDPNKPEEDIGSWMIYMAYGHRHALSIFNEAVREYFNVFPEAYFEVFPK